MRTSFLQEVAARYLELSSNYSNIALIFPNKRAGIFFKKELAFLHPKVQWMPEYFSSEDFVKAVTNIQIADPITLLFEFYTVYQECETDQAEPFDVFSTWATQLLHDFQEIDLYCVDAKQLFGTINDAYAIKNWNPDGSVITENQQQYLRFWSRMGKWYQAFRSHLQDKNIASSAMAYRRFAEKCVVYAEQIPFDKIVFAGFNALNKSEQTFMRHLEKIGKAEIIWDADSYYVDNELNEAGQFLRKYRKEWSIRDFKNCEPHLETIDRKIHIVGVAKNIGQAFVAGSVIDQLAQTEKDLTSTSLVLCDEQLLMPVLEVLPEKIEHVNITMGYPMHLLPVSSLFSLIFDLQLHARMSGKSEKREIAFYFRDLLRLFRNPSLASALQSEILQPLVDQLMREKRIYFPISTIIKKSPESKNIISKLEFLFQPWEDNPAMAIKSLQDLVAFLRDEQIKSGKALQGLETEALYAVSKLLQQIENLRSSFSGFTSVRTLQRIFQQLIRSQTSPFFGEPLSGLQLMGLLETRNLDFKNLILLSVNEGILPASKTQRSFIPHDISSFFELPTYRERDAVFAYHFYRMIQRAENVWLVYNTETDEFGKGEQSRYITQLEEELKSAHTQISREIYIPQLNMTPESIISVEKTPELLRKLMNRIGGGNEKMNLSPTGISNYINCSLQFYFRYLSGIKVDQSKADDIGADLLGTVAHGVLEAFYKPFEGRVINQHDLQSMLPNIHEAVRQSFVAAEVDLRDLESGTNLLTFKGIEKMISNFIHSEIELVNELAESGQVLSIEKIEGDLQKVIHVDVLGELLPISFKGRTDRIDRIGNTLRVVDYKSGGVKAVDVILSNQTDIINNPKKAKALQLMQYALMTPEKYSNFDVLPGIISLRQPSLGLVALTVNKIEGLSPEERIETEQVFHQIANEIVNPEIPFEKTNDVKRCKYCDYKAICHR